MASPLKKFLDTTTEEWFNNNFEGKLWRLHITSSLHGGQETTLISMMLPLLHHGMIIAGVPYSESALTSTKSGAPLMGHLMSRIIIKLI